MLAPVRIVLGGIVVQGALGPGVEARITVLVIAKALRPEPQTSVQSMLIDIADQPLTKIFRFTYVNTIDSNTVHRAVRPCNPCELGVDYAPTGHTTISIFQPFR